MFPLLQVPEPLSLRVPPEKETPLEMLTPPLALSVWLLLLLPNWPPLQVRRPEVVMVSEPVRSPLLRVMEVGLMLASPVVKLAVPPVMFSPLEIETGEELKVTEPPLAVVAPEGL